VLVIASFPIGGRSNADIGGIHGFVAFSGIRKALEARSVDR
jgi:hypothetical protein